MERRRFKLLLNREGNDIEVIVDDLETASLLLNDQDAAEQFLQNFDFDEVQEPLYLPTVVDSENKTPSELEAGPVCWNSSAHCDSNLKANSTYSEIIWCRKKPTEDDIEATSILLKLRQEMSPLFDDKKTIKSKLWQRIANTLSSSFNLGENGAEKCRQKFANLQRAYLAYVTHQKTTGSEKNDNLPPFFEELHSILGSKDKVNPTFLVDSMEIEESEENSMTNADSGTSEKDTDKIQESRTNEETVTGTTNQSSTSKTHTDRFKTTRKQIKPTGKNEALLIEIQKDRESREKQFSFFEEHLKKTDEQRERFLNIIERAFPPRKRKRQEFSSESD